MRAASKASVATSPSSILASSNAPVRGNSILSTATDVEDRAQRPGCASRPISADLEGWVANWSPPSLEKVGFLARRQFSASAHFVDQ